MIYAVGWKEEGPLKLGFSTNPQQRLHDLQTGNPNLLRIMAKGRITQPLGSRLWTNRSVERAIHAAFKDRHVRGEWFDVGLSDVVAMFPRIEGQRGYVTWE